MDLYTCQITLLVLKKFPSFLGAFIIWLVGFQSIKSAPWVVSNYNGSVYKPNYVTCANKKFPSFLGAFQVAIASVSLMPRSNSVVQLYVWWLMIEYWEGRLLAKIEKMFHIVVKVWYNDLIFIFHIYAIDFTPFTFFSQLKFSGFRCFDLRSLILFRTFNACALTLQYDDM